MDNHELQAEAKANMYEDKQYVHLSEVSEGPTLSAFYATDYEAYSKLWDNFSGLM